MQKEMKETEEGNKEVGIGENEPWDENILKKNVKDGGWIS